MKGSYNEERDFRSTAQAAIALMFLALGLMIWDQQGSRELASKPATPIPQEKFDPQAPILGPTLTKINRHLQLTERQTDLNTLTMEVENVEFAPGIQIDRRNRIHQSTGLQNPFETEDLAGRVFNDLEPNAGRYDKPVLPADRVNSLMEQRKWLDEYSEKQREEFIQAVQDNARAAGYELRINEDLEVVKVNRLPNASD